MGLTIPTVEKACICLDLKTGTLILGVINLVRNKEKKIVDNDLVSS